MSQKIKIALGGAVVAAVITIIYFVFFAGMEGTDDAQVGGHMAILSTKVPGLVQEVLIDENYKVKKGDILVRIDKRDYINVRDQLQSELASAQAKFRQAQKDFARAQNLVKEKAIPAQEMDAAQSLYDDLKSKASAIESQLKQAELNIEYTDVRAPEDGTIGKKSVEPGMVVSTTQPLMFFVSSQTPWVTANFKETQVRHMKIGDHAKISIDSIGGKSFEGQIESFSPGTGATFALIPPDNATGNFTKIVQRVPVRVRLTAESTKGFEDRIVPGLSADVTVYVK